MSEVKKSFFVRMTERAMQLWQYWSVGVWRTEKKGWGVRIVKIINLTVRSFLDRDLQLRSAALTYTSVLATVPVIALLFAIGRGFGFQNILENELYLVVPAQRETLRTVLGFVDSYLAQTGQGLFVGVGIVVLLWTLISLLSNIEDAFNSLWGIKQSRSIYQKVTDYIAICLLVPVLMICSSGATIFVSTIVQSNLRLPFLTPVINACLELVPLILGWLAFSLSYYLIPNIKVNFKYAAVAGAFAAVGYAILQALFVNGQIYVTKYNAIYGSFSFLPLMLVWMQMSWLLLLTGCVITYSMQNVLNYNYMGDIKGVSPNYMRKIAVVAGAIIARRFAEGETPVTVNELSTQHDIPITLAHRLDDLFSKAKLVYHVELGEGKIGLTPSFDSGTFTARDLLTTLDRTGTGDFIPRFDSIYPEVVARVNEWNSEAWEGAGDVLLRDCLQAVGEEETETGNGG